MTLLIKNIQLLDGTGRPAVKSDVLIRNEKISAIADNLSYKADETIDGLGAYLAPGFIDINNHSDRHLDIFLNPSQEQFLSQGITTIIGGLDGFSLAPLLYGSLQSIRPYADVDKINVNWQTLVEFLKIMSKKPLAVNFGTMIGHTTVRRALIGEPIFRHLTDKELKVFNLIFKENLKMGAFGISAGLDNPLVSQTPYFEIKKLAEIAAQAKKIFAVSLKNKKEGLLNSIKRIIYLAKETGAKFLINDFLPFVGFEKSYEKALKLIDEASAYADIHFTVYPFEEYTTLISSFLPDWAKEPSREATLKNFQNPAMRKKIILSLARLNKDMVIVNAVKNRYLVGKSLKEFFEKLNLGFGKGLLQLMTITELRAEVSYKAVNYQVLLKALTHPQSLVSSAGKFLELVEREKILPIETAIKKISFLAAKKLNLRKRGEIKIGYFADLVIFKDGKIREVILNGKHSVKDGQFQNVFSGKVFKIKI